MSEHILKVFFTGWACGAATTAGFILLIVESKGRRS
jgi:hypothetical protein